MLKKILFLIVFLLTTGSGMLHASADKVTYNNRDSIGFVGKYDLNDQERKNQEKNNGLTLSENKQIGKIIPSAGDSSPLPQLMFSILGGALLIYSTQNLIRYNNHKLQRIKEEV
ncbi:hypothetical protein [Lactococcus garvieae]|uniref:Gram-positive cocci surface proteins LPxTG domain-containing protein n=1 Tax=Lactococcus garvieae DCC43 TaxID=1231377 RepID=K2PJG6_9LACT|nr:hypothetical protein [Lactococcus garvieae]EKF51520.1 hypothetical protein C426_1107 [Lactococcus garvieae DCC43]